MREVPKMSLDSILAYCSLLIHGVGEIIQQLTMKPKIIFITLYKS